MHSIRKTSTMHLLVPPLARFELATPWFVGVFAERKWLKLNNTCKSRPSQTFATMPPPRPPKSCKSRAVSWKTYRVKWKGRALGKHSVFCTAKNPRPLPLWARYVAHRNVAASLQSTQIGAQSLWGWHRSTRPQRINNSWVPLCRLRMMETTHSLSVAYLSGIAYIRKSSR